ncbi:MAG: hypothetical protein HOD58_06755 [Gammaproteobacteria bacterium]|nr:hypothetical protein [Gammaproteobacteria bacterium]MBT4131802.1 hypothetical protein [Candidatus Neomarinimicrobiota bacterium]MBT4605766.1 hypothetical protein [Thiotrichales bacterium]MBT4329607.1 hypothetical protein [Gammaproteobacteria bacterium]MBT5634991.1 hypothetical protein [Gammaproteobacteria bacterium]
MGHSARLYNCACCGQQVILCSHCDWGNRYCFDGCSKVARKESLGDAGRRYQNTRQGRINNAKRQAEYRIRQALSELEPPPTVDKVTHHGSEEGTPSASIEIDEQRGEECSFDSLYHCHRCGRVVDHYLRSGYLRYSSPLSPDSSPLKQRA